MDQSNRENPRAGVKVHQRVARYLFYKRKTNVKLRERLYPACVSSVQSGPQRRITEDLTILPGASPERGPFR